MRALFPILLLLLIACAQNDVEQGGTSEPEMGTPDVVPDVLPDAPSPDAEPAAEPDAEPMLPDMPWDPTEPGFYGVGFRSGEIEYVPFGATEARPLRVVVWYPTLDEEGETASYGGLLPREGIYDGASVAIDAPAPVLVFSHGSTSFAEQSFFMTEFFASHGWIVVAMDHTGNLFRDGGIEPEIFGLRPQDVSAVLDHIYSLDEDDPLSGLFSEDVVLSGHSFGGYTTLAAAGASFNVEAVDAACEEGQLPGDFCAYFETQEVVDLFTAGFLDPRVKLALPQAPFGGPVFGDGVADIDIPVLLFTAAGDRTLPPEQDGDPIWEGLDGEDDLRVDVLTGGHFTFSNACDLRLGIGDDDGCGPDFIGPERSYNIVNSYSMVFCRRHLFGDMEHLGILDGSVEVDSDVLLYLK